MAKATYTIDLTKIKPVVTNIDSRGVKKLLKSDSVNDDLKEVARDIQQNFKAISNSDDWEIAQHERPSRSTWIIFTNNTAVKWREVASGKLAKWVRSSLMRGPLRRKK